MSFAHAATRVPLPTAFRPRRLLVIAALSLTLSGALPSPAAAAWMTTTMPAFNAAPNSEAARVLNIAAQHLRDRWKFAAIGPNQFDCSGFVWYVFREAGLRDRVGNKRKGAIAYWNWFKKQGLATGPNSLADAKAGDLLIWGRGAHMGIYIGNNWAISTLINPYGVTIHKVNKITHRLTAVLHVRMSRGAPDATPDPSPSPSTSP